MEEVFNRGNFEVDDVFVAPDFRNHEMSADARLGNRPHLAGASFTLVGRSS